jgi:hypothetical protein
MAIWNRKRYGFGRALVVAGAFLITSAAQPQPNPQNIARVASVTVLQRSNFVNTPRLYLQGYYAPNDGGEGLFDYLPTDRTSPDNACTIIVDSAGHRFSREQSGHMFSVLWCGAKGNGVTNDAPQFSVAATLANGRTLYVPYKTSGYIISTGFSVSGATSIYFEPSTRLLCLGNTACVTYRGGGPAIGTSLTNVQLYLSGTGSSQTGIYFDQGTGSVNVSNLVVYDTTPSNKATCVRFNKTFNYVFTAGYIRNCLVPMTSTVSSGAYVNAVTLNHVTFQNDFGFPSPTAVIDIPVGNNWRLSDVLLETASNATAGIDIGNASLDAKTDAPFAISIDKLLVEGTFKYVIRSGNGTYGGPTPKDIHIDYPQCNATVNQAGGAEIYFRKTSISSFRVAFWCASGSAKNYDLNNTNDSIIIEDGNPTGALSIDTARNTTIMSALGGTSGQFTGTNYLQSGKCQILSGAGSPIGTVNGGVCWLYLNASGGPGTTLYVNETGGLGGWVAK